MVKFQQVNAGWDFTFLKTITEDKNATAKLVIPVTYHGSSPYNGVTFFNQKTNRHAVKKTTTYLEFANREKKA